MEAENGFRESKDSSNKMEFVDATDTESRKPADSKEVALGSAFSLIFIILISQLPDGFVLQGECEPMTLEND